MGTVSPRYETPFEITLTDDQARRLAQDGRSRSREQLIVELSGNTLHAKWPANDTFDHPAEFDGRVEPRAGGVLIDGRIRESWSNMTWARIWVIPTFIAAACIVIGVVAWLAKDVRAGLPPLLIGLVGTPAMALMWRWQRHLRRPVFDRDARKLSEGLSRYLTTGNGTRPVR